MKRWICGFGGFIGLKGMGFKLVSMSLDIWIGFGYKWIFI